MEKAIAKVDKYLNDPKEFSVNDRRAYNRLSHEQKRDFILDEILDIKQLD